MLLIRMLRGRPRFFAAVLVGLLAAVLLPHTHAALTRHVLAWDIGCTAFLALVAHLFSSERDMAHDAAAQEEGEWTVFAITVGAVAASFAAVLGEFVVSKDAPASTRDFHIALVAATLMLSWLVTHTVFALRYAHEYYAASSPGALDKGLEFPGNDAPDYWDFMYFSVVLGMTFQVSDVQITSRKLRRLATLHGFLSFLFNTVLLALSVNIGASLL